MTNRDLFEATMRHENGDALLYIEQGFNVRHKVWRSEGLPAHVRATSYPTEQPGEDLFDHFNVCGFYPINLIEQFCLPGYPMRVLSDDGRVRVIINRLGNTVQEISPQVQVNRDDGAMLGSPPHEIDFLIKTPEDYQKYRPLFTDGVRNRIDWTQLEQIAPLSRAATDHIPSLWVHGPFAYLREILGTENAMVLQYEEPEMIDRMLTDHLNKMMEAAEPIIRACQPQCCYVWEDCCGFSGPFIAPTMFDRFFAKWYRAWKDYLVQLGVRWAVLDTDGDPSPLITRWYQSGIDLLFPFEVNSVNLLKAAREHPEFVMMGGLYKHIFEPDSPAQVGRFTTRDPRVAIDAELKRVLPEMRARGGYFPSLDHWIHPHSHYQDYKYFSEALTAYGKANRVLRTY